MAWVTEAYVKNSITTAATTALGLTGTVFTQFEAEARSTVVAAMQHAGYAAPASITIDGTSDAGSFLAQLVTSIVLRDAYQLRKGVRLPFDPSSRISDGLSRLDALYEKKLPIPGMEPDSLDGYGGSKGSPIVGTDAVVAKFRNLAGF